MLTLQLDKVNVQAGVPGLNRNDAYRKMISLPALSVQQQIVAEIEGEHTLVDANRELMERLEKRLQIVIARVWREEIPT